MTTVTPLAPTRCYGTYQHLPAGGGRGQWALTARPDVAIKIKRLWPRMQQNRTGTLLICATPETSQDLEWFMQRWPLAPADPESLDILTGQAKGHRETEDLVARMLAGYVPPPGPGRREPALPPYPHQEVVPRLVDATGRLLCCDDLGAGKTFEALLLLCETRALPAVVVTMTQLPLQWQREAAKFTPWLTTYVATSSKPYPFTQPDGQQELPFGVDVTTADRKSVV